MQHEMQHENSEDDTAPAHRRGIFHKETGRPDLSFRPASPRHFLLCSYLAALLLYRILYGISKEIVRQILAYFSIFF